MNLKLTALLSGLLFGAGLMLSGMADTQRVLAFLTLGPDWDPSLMLVMAAALCVSVPAFAWVRRHGKSLLGAELPAAAGAIDRRLLGGAALFGLGWGLIGFCPGPAIVSAGLLQAGGILFVAAMLIGAWLADRLFRD